MPASAVLAAALDAGLGGAVVLLRERLLVRAEREAIWRAGPCAREEPARPLLPLESCLVPDPVRGQLAGHAVLRGVARGGRERGVRLPMPRTEPLRLAGACPDLVPARLVCGRRGGRRRGEAAGLWRAAGGGRAAGGVRVLLGRVHDVRSLDACGRGVERVLLVRAAALRLCVVCDGPCAGRGHAGAWPGAVRAVDSGGAAADDARLSSARARHRHVGMGREGASPL